ncbi:DUF5802 family protein [Halalkalicoccus tibetensis]|uniref:DUF5802 family protein n=1 Tax=Halalkalicoccus tibetensis TaxID=175632 RepID=A0ABD5UXU8_9EURY
MFETFSRSYYVGRLFVEPYDGEHAALCREQHELVNEQLYADGSGIERLDHPLVMKLAQQHFAVHGEDGVPEHTLMVPRERIDSTDADALPAPREVLLAKADRASQLLDIVSAGRAGR